MNFRSDFVTLLNVFIKYYNTAKEFASQNEKYIDIFKKLTNKMQGSDAGVCAS